MLIDLGMGVRHRNVRYNARVLCTYRKIFCIRPKMALANDGLYREARHFTAWTKQRQIETYYLEGVVQKVTGQRSVPIGDMILSTPDTAVACESCEEMFVPLNPSIFTGLNGVRFESPARWRLCCCLVYLAGLILTRHGTLCRLKSFSTRVLPMVR